MSNLLLSEHLESRQFYAVDVAIAFQPITARRPADMLIDYGAAYAVRRGGLSYGWESDKTAQTVERHLAPVRKNDRFIALNHNDTWQMAVPNGSYKLYLVGGDPAQVGDRMAITVEGQPAIAGITRRTKPYLEAAVTTTVTDGKLTIASAGVWNTDKLNYLAIQSVPAVGGDTPVTTARISWTRGPRQLVARVEPESAVVDDKLYVFSGYGDLSTGGTGWQPSSSYERYDPATNKWTALGKMPIATTHAAVAVVGKDIWFAGGYTARPGTNDRQDITNTNVLIYHTATNTWSRGPALPQKRASGGLGLVGNKLYYISGEPVDHKSDSVDTWVLDLANQSAGWATRAPIPQGRTHFGTAVVNNKIYVIGGQKGIDETSLMFNTAYSYDPATNRWTQLANLPLKRSHLSPNTIVVNNKILSFGGEQAFDKTLKSVLQYDPATNKFTELTPLPSPRAAGSAGYVGGKLVFTGGKNAGFFSDTFIGTFV